MRGIGLPDTELEPWDEATELILLNEAFESLARYLITVFALLEDFVALQAWVESLRGKDRRLP